MATTDQTLEDLFLPDPPPRQIKYTVISVDDHLVEPPDMFEGRLEARFADRAPRIVEDDKGHQVWEFDGSRFTQVGMNAVAGRRPNTYGLEPFRFEQMRRGCWDIKARIADMDINGVWASLSFPSMITGFCGRVFSQCSDPELGLAVTRAWNDWLFEEWYSPYPERIIPLGITFLADPVKGAEEIRRNAARGFRSIALPERPQRIGFPSLFSGHWEPILEACAETDTVISVHVGSSGGYEIPPDCSETLALGATMFGQLSLAACAEWLWSGAALRHPNLKIAMSEGGIGWVPMLLDRLDNIVDRSGYGRAWEMRPADVLKRNFWFCTLDDPSTIDCRERIGVDRIMVEVDYPHGDGTWPDTQAVIEHYWGHIPPDELRAMCCENAAALYRHPLPDVVLP
ncbi:MAG TPA: amidohydrolase family protein [Acidimicrobiales bacterium]|jgi:predicted TIM-barrel fold metal-dependent hydrolase